MGKGIPVEAEDTKNNSEQRSNSPVKYLTRK